MLTAPNSPGLTLRKILANGSLLGANEASYKVKVILFYLLTKGVWQFYESNLMPTEWTKDTVEFLFEHREHNGTLTAGVFLNQPLISADPQYSATRQLQQKGPYKSHPYPKILGLGIMLLEILLGREIDSFRGEPEALPFLADGKVTPYTDHRIARWLFDKRVRTDRNMFGPLTDVIGRCLDGKSLSLTAKSKGSNQPFSGRLREAMYEELVAPLETLFDVMYRKSFDLNPLHELNQASAPAPAGGARPARRQTIPAGDAGAIPAGDLKEDLCELIPHSKIR